MKVCLVTYGTFFDPAAVVAGNSVRAYYLARALVERGVEVVHLYPDVLARHARADAAVPAGIRVRTYRDGPDLLAEIERERPAAVLVGYWELLEHFPERYAFPIIVDVVAPRILENLFEDRDLTAEADRLVRLYRRADLFLAGNERQRHFLLPWLILAGFRCATGAPVAVVPISTEPRAAEPRAPGDGEWRFVTGGVSWPWRRTEAYFEPLVAALPQGPARLDLFEGRYVYGGADAQPRRWSSERVTSHDLLPYGEMQTFLATTGHVGVELADYNLEREFSQSFRSADFLRNGLPVLCNRYTELAGWIEAYDAGWVVDDPGQIPEVMRRIFTSREEWTTKSRNARRLVEERLHYARTIEPVHAFLREPRRPERGLRPLLTASLSAPERHAPTLPAFPSVPLRRRLRGATASFLRALLPTRSDAILMVTRSDVFPADHGAAVKIDRTARGLAESASAVYLVTDDPKRYHRYQGGRHDELRYPWLIRKVTPRRERVRKRLLAAGLPSDDAFLYHAAVDWGFVVRALYIAVRHGVRRYQAEFPAYAKPCLRARRLLGGVAAIVEHNVEYQRIAAQHPDLPESVRRWLRGLELRLCDRVDVVVAVSNDDRDALVRDGVPPEKVRVIPHGVDLAAFERAARLDTRRLLGLPPDCPLLVYHGTYQYPPNLDAVQVLADEILPRLHQRGIRPKVLAVGPFPPASSPHADIVFTGSVPEVAPYLLDADVAVVPLRSGGGTRMKVLDYFAARVPVVGSSKGLEGLALVDGEQALIRDDPDAFAAAVAELLGSPARRAALAEAGRKHVAALDWSRIAERYLAEYRAREMSGATARPPARSVEKGGAGTAAS
ncbi:glycosyltransferase [Anaeromyxobacter oryzisoli]|uniref:glycosyltransferase n=1 Tax=Anaeromyxobacter oryzisoli TaxID=2925408 RepID=UPI001F5866D4|nr:glycosyltransferase [Anaeromyxobacter sp. SG63]